MTPKALPTKLGKEPLIDVVCEVRFESSVPASSLLPGLILGHYGDKQVRLEPLPAAQLPQLLREQDPNLRHAALMRIMVDDQFAILISDRSLAVGCKMPYVGWSLFKEACLTTFSVLLKASFIQKVVRHSLKYVDLFETSEQTKPSLSRFAVKLAIAGREISDEVVNLRVEIPDSPFLHATAVVSPALVQREDGEKKTGAIVDVDTHRVQEFASTKDFVEQLPELLEAIHSSNKSFFFSLLSESGLKELDPHYD